MKKLKESDARIIPLRKLGKSLPKIKRVRKKSPDKGIKLDTSKIAPQEIYNEAIHNLSVIKDSFSTSKDLSKILKKNENDVTNTSSKFMENEYNISNDNNLSSQNNSHVNKRNLKSNLQYEGSDETEFLNESFGNPKSKRGNKYDKSKSSDNEVSDNENINNQDNSFLTNTNHSLNIVNDISRKSKKSAIETIDMTNANASSLTPNITTIHNKNYPTNHYMNNISSLMSNTDTRLEYVLKILDLENLFHILNSNKLTFNDLLFLSKEDLMEMSIPLGPRNRILKFSECYRLYGRDFSLEEIIEFFRDNKNFVFNSKYSESIRQTPTLRFNTGLEEEKVNFYESNVLSTANFNNEYIQSQHSLKKKNIPYDNEVFQPKILDSLQSVFSKENNVTLANYISYNSKNLSNNNLNQSLQNVQNINLPLKMPQNYNDRIRRINTNKFEKENILIRSDSEEKAIQTEKVDPEASNQNLLPTSRKLSTVNTLEENKFKDESAQINNVFTNNLEERNKNSDRITDVVPEEEEIKKETEEIQIVHEKSSYTETLKDKSTMSKTNKKNKSTTMGFRKISNINKDFENISNEVEKYIRSYKELKEKSDDINNRFGCIIKKSQGARSKSKDNHIHHHYNTFLNNSTKYNSRNFNSNLVEVNSDDLELEQERNLNEEINKLLNRINSASNLNLDSQSLQQLNKIKSLTNANMASNQNFKLMDVNMINNEIDKLYDIWNKKHDIQSNLNLRNTHIIENKKLLKLLDDESTLEKEMSMEIPQNNSQNRSIENYSHPNRINQTVSNKSFNQSINSYSNISNQSGVYQKKRLSKLSN